MRRIGRSERLLLATLWPLWLICLGFHIQEIARTGFAGGAADLRGS